MNVIDQQTKNTSEYFFFWDKSISKVSFHFIKNLPVTMDYFFLTKGNKSNF